MRDRPLSLPPGALRYGLSVEVLQDRVCAETLDAAYAVHAALGPAHDRITYRNALVVELLARNTRAERNATFSVLYRQKVVGTFEADVLVEGQVLVQVNASPMLTEAQKSVTLRGLAAGGVKLGLAFNFGAPELFFARLF